MGQNEILLSKRNESKGKKSVDKWGEGIKLEPYPELNYFLTPSYIHLMSYPISNSGKSDVSRKRKQGTKAAALPCNSSS